MTLKIQLIVGAMAVIAMLVIINFIRKKKLDLRYGLSWLLVICVILVLDFFPGILSWLTNLMGVEIPANMLFFLGFCFSLLIIFGLTMIVSGLSHKVKRLSQELALLDKRINDMEAESGGSRE